MASFRGRQSVVNETRPMPKSSASLTACIRATNSACNASEILDRLPAAAQITSPSESRAMHPQPPVPVVQLVYAASMFINTQSCGRACHLCFLSSLLIGGLAQNSDHSFGQLGNLTSKLGRGQSTFPMSFLVTFRPPTPKHTHCSHLPVLDPTEDYF